MSDLSDRIAALVNQDDPFLLDQAGNPSPFRRSMLKAHTQGNKVLVARLVPLVSILLKEPNWQEPRAWEGEFQRLDDFAQPWDAYKPCLCVATHHFFWQFYRELSGNWLGVAWKNNARASDGLVKRPVHVMPGLARGEDLANVAEHIILAIQGFEKSPPATDLSSGTVR